MKAKIHALQVEIETIEKLMDSLNNQMKQLAQEEVKNLQFELDMLNRSAMRTNMPQPAPQTCLAEAGVYA